MKINLTKYILLLVILALTLKAQTNTNIPDSVQSKAVEKAVQLIFKSDSMTLADSLNKAIVKQQLDNLNSGDQSKRIALEIELDRLKQKDSLQKAQMIAEVERLKKQAIGYPVIVHKDTLFKVYTQIGSVTAEERSHVIAERLQKLYRTYNLKTDTLNIQNNAGNVEIYYKDKILLSVTDLDELWYEHSKSEIAHAFLNRITIDIAIYKEDQSLAKKLKEFGLALLVIVIQVLLIIGINKLFKFKINKLVLDKRGTWFNGIHFKDHELLDVDKQATAVIFLLKLVRYFIILILLYISIPILFSIFPVTQRLAEVLFGYIIYPIKSIGKAIIGYIPKLITIIIIIIITRYFLKLLRYVTHEIETERFKIPGFFADWAKPTYNIVKILVLAFALIVIFPYLPGSESAVFKGVSVFIGIVFSLGSSSIIGNIVAGLVITYMRPFKLGDRIKIGDVVGNVVEKTPFVTRIRTPKKEFITIPNSNILSSNVINYSKSKQQGGLVVYTSVTIGYDVPWRQVHQLLINAAKKTSNLNHDIAPFVLQTSLDDFYVSYQINAHTMEPDKQPQIYSELHQNIQDGFNEAGVEIMSPHYRAERDGNDVTIPKDFLTKENK